MSAQYVVVYFADGTLVADAVGPFRSRARAVAAMEALTETDDERIDHYDPDEYASMLPQLVKLGSVQMAQRSLGISAPVQPVPDPAQDEADPDGAS